MGDQLKEAAFTMLVLLVAVSGVYEWAASDTLLKTNLGVSAVHGFEGQTLVSDLNGMVFSGEHLITTNPLADIPAYMGALLLFFSTIWNIFMKIMFGWMGLLDAIFSSIGLPGISIVFKAPIAIIQIVAGLYFIRDIVNTIRGVG